MKKIISTTIILTIEEVFRILIDNKYINPFSTEAKWMDEATDKIRIALEQIYSKEGVLEVVKRHLSEQLNYSNVVSASFKENSLICEVSNEEEISGDNILLKNMEILIREADLSIRSYNTIRELIRGKKDLIMLDFLQHNTKIRNAGRVTWIEIGEFLDGLGIDVTKYPINKLIKM